MTISQKTKKLVKAIKCQETPKKLNIFSLKIHKSAGILKKSKNFLNEGTEHKTN